MHGLHDGLAREGFTAAVRRACQVAMGESWVGIFHPRCQSDMVDARYLGHASL